MSSISPNASHSRRGRPRNSEIYGGHIRQAENKIADRLPELIDNLLALAGGIWFQETPPDGETRTVYKRSPDRQANEYLINRIMGKPVESISMEMNDIEDAEDTRNFLDPNASRKKKPVRSKKKTT